MFTPPERPGTGLGCGKVVRKYSQLFSPEGYYVEGCMKNAIFNQYIHYYNGRRIGTRM